MLASTWNGTPPISVSSLSFSLIRSAVSMAPTVPAVSGRSTANSSPPRRATVSLERTARVRRPARSRNSWYAVMPERVVDLLEPIQVQQQHGGLRAVPFGHPQRHAGPIGEKAAVREGGERVSGGLTPQLPFLDRHWNQRPYRTRRWRRPGPRGRSVRHRREPAGSRWCRCHQVPLVRRDGASLEPTNRHKVATEGHDSILLGINRKFAIGHR